MPRMTGHFIATCFFIFLCLLSSCATPANTVRIDDATAAKLKAEVTIYDSKKMSGVEYSVVRPIHATACGSRESAMDQLRYIARSAGADGITKINCGSLLGPSLAQNCLTTVMCEAIAIKVGTRVIEPEKVKTQKTEETAKKQVMSQANGFTLGGLPLVVTSYNAVGESRDAEIIFSGNYITRGKIIKRDQKNDLAIISFEEFRIAPAGFRIFPSYKVRLGQDVYVVGLSVPIQPGEKPGVTQGTVSSMEGIGEDSRYFGITGQCDLSAGGSPLLDSQGRLIGIISPATNKAYSAGAKEHASHVTCFALKSSLLLDLYPEIEDLVTSENGPAISPQQILDAYGSSVVTVIAK